MKIIGPLFAALVASLSLVRAEDTSLRNLGLASTIEKKINAIATFTSTMVSPAPGKREGAISFLVISEKPVLGNDKAKYAWLVVSVGAVGFVLNEHREIRAEEVWFADLAMTKQGRALALPADTIKALQAQAKADRIDTDQLYAGILKGLVEKKVDVANGTSPAPNRATPAKAPPSTTPPPTKDASQANITLGMTKPQVSARLGEPNMKTETSWVYSGRGRVRFRDEKVSSIEPTQ